MKVGIFSGTFDPVHKGHIAFALAAADNAGLDKVYFLPEAAPRRKSGVTHQAHRLAMLKLALRPYTRLDILELPDKQFSVAGTLPRIKRLLPEDELYLLIGSDALEFLNSKQWSGLAALLSHVRLIVGVREDSDVTRVSRQLDAVQPEGIVIEASWPGVSSRKIRAALHAGKGHQELLGSIKPYITKHWLYASIDGAPTKDSL